jgi:hypothetical protein
MSSIEASATGMPLRRPLAVQLAALNNDEMKSYTQILREIAALEDDRLQGNTGTIISSDYEQLVVNSRDVRAWIRGRYPCISLANIDAILKFFHPNPQPTDQLTGKHVFAALRIMIHVTNGAKIDRDLAFYQPGTRPGVHLFDGFQKSGTWDRPQVIHAPISQNAASGPSTSKPHPSAERPPSSLTRPIVPTEVVRVEAPQRNQAPSPASSSQNVIRVPVAPELRNPSRKDDGERPPKRTSSQHLPALKPTERASAKEPDAKPTPKARDKGLRSGQKRLEAGDIVLGKLEGYPPWPGHVCDPKNIPAEIMKEHLSGEFRWAVRFFPEGDYAWLETKDISHLQQHEITGYLDVSAKTASADLMEAYRIAINPEDWLRSKDQEMQQEEVRTDDGSSPKKRKRSSDQRAEVRVGPPAFTRKPRYISAEGPFR